VPGTCRTRASQDRSRGRCDGKDNDCNGQIDEGLGTITSCSTDLPGAWATEITATDAADCAAHDGEACVGFAADPDAGAGTRTCVYQKLPWCGI
jgi:hypothetical protein